MLKRKKFILLLANISLFLLVSMIQDSYAKYVSQATANGNFAIAQWAFQVNKQDVLTNSDFGSTIIPSFTPNENVKDGVLAPTSEGYFDLVIDSSKVDVSFQESITLAPDITNTVTDLKITSYSLNGGEKILFNDSTSIITDHLLTEEKKLNTYRVYVSWLDGTDETMDNKKDTEASKAGSAKVNVQLSFIQKA